MRQFTVLLLALSAGAWNLKERPWMDNRLPVDQRVAALLPKLNVEELSAQVRAPNSDNADTLIALYANLSVGTSTLLSIADINKVQAAVLNNSRWGIPVAWQHESLHGGCFGGTVFPMPLSLGSTWNTSLLLSIYDAIANETRACGANIAFAPVINLFNDPRYGRFEEGLSPDPALTALYTRYTVLGLQGSIAGNASTYLPPGKVVSLGKHFMGYGGGSGGLNSGMLHASEREVRDVYLKPWREFAKCGGRGAMPSHQTVLDVPMHANDYMTNQVFRKELGFGNGLTISDCNDVGVLVNFRVAHNASDAAAKALKGGVDQDLQCGQETYTYTNIKAALDSGLLDLSTLQTAVKHVLTMKFASGLFENPYVNPAGMDHLDPPAYRALAREAAEQSTVLLKNAGNALPLPANANWANTAMVGYLASDAAYYSLTGPYSSLGAPIETYNSTFFPMHVKYSEGAHPDTPADPAMINSAVQLAKSAERTLLFLGDSINTCGEWMDRSDLDLPGGQTELLTQMVASKVPNLILVLVGGRPVTFGVNNTLLNGVSSVLWVGRPGEAAGSALWNILTGVTNPSGKLQASWVKNVGHVGSGATPFQQPIVGKWAANQRTPADPDGRVYDNYVFDPNGEASPLFHFGYGLSYTTFKVDKMTVMPYNTQSGTVTVMYDVTNTGSRAGAEVTQVYIIDPIGAPVVRPWKRLVQISKEYLEAGASTTVSVIISYEDLALTSLDMKSMTVRSGIYAVRVGTSSYDDQVAGYFTYGAVP